MRICIKAPIKEELEIGDFLYTNNKLNLLVFDNFSGDYLWVNLSNNTIYHSRYKSIKDALKVFADYPYRIIKSNEIYLQEEK